MIINLLILIFKLLRIESLLIFSFFNFYFIKSQNVVIQNNFINRNNYAVNTYGKRNVITTEKSLKKNNNYIDRFVGRLTTYSPKCNGCSSLGNVACKTRNKKTFSLIKDGQYYNDTEYGKIRVVAAATSKFRCGTVIEIKKKGKNPVLAVVLDTGGSMRKAWNNKKVWIDLAYTDTKMAKTENLVGKNIEFNILRYGW